MQMDKNIYCVVSDEEIAITKSILGIATIGIISFDCKFMLFMLCILKWLDMKHDLEILFDFSTV